MLLAHLCRQDRSRVWTMKLATSLPRRQDDQAGWHLDVLTPRPEKMVCGDKDSSRLLKECSVDGQLEVSWLEARHIFLRGKETVT